MTDQREAQKLWSKILELERMPVKSEQDFKVKSREMAALRAAYAKATGTSCDPGNEAEREAKSRANLLRGFNGQERSQPTRDELNDLPDFESKFGRG